MSTQQYRLRWNNHQPNFISTFTSLLNTQTLVDVTLSAEGKQLLAHKVVLAACSTYFQNIFVDNPTPHPVVILKDVTYSDLRTMVDFMYYGVVNVTEDQLPKVLDTAKLLNVKGLTEMPDSASLTRASSDRNGTDPPPPQPQPQQVDPMDQQRESPPDCPNQQPRKRRRRKSSSSKTVIVDECAPGPSSQPHQITFSSVPQRRYNEIRTVDYSQQTQDTSEAMDQGVGISEAEQEAQAQAQSQLQGGSGGSSVLKSEGSGVKSDGGGVKGEGGGEANPRRAKVFKRQARVPDTEVRKQSSEPAAASARAPPPAKHDSFPIYAAQGAASRKPDTSALLVRGGAAGGAVGGAGEAGGEGAPRASHTPAVRSGPPLSCNFCWNTVDECGRILRRKTQYHCPECRTNLCIVPCFHEYHDGPESDSNTNAR